MRQKLANLALALRHFHVRAMATGIAEDQIRRELDAVRREIEEVARAQLDHDAAVPPPMREYVARAFEEAGQ